METVRSVSNRDSNLDFVKGILVIFMVIYHIMNYFTTAGAEEFEYVRFVSGSFIFLSGYIVSTFYEKKYRSDKAGISQQLFIRGLKLLIIFTTLNVLINLTGIGNPNKPTPNIEQFLNNVTTIYFSGERRFAAFQILLSISYLLMLSPVLLFFAWFMKSGIGIILAAMFCFLFLNMESEIFEMGLVGITGFSIGVVMNKLEISLFFKNWIIVLLCLLICIYLFKYFDRNVMTYTMGIMIVLKLFYDLAKTINLKNKISKSIILFGRYTLVCYIVQIIFLHGLSWILSRQRWSVGYEIISIFVITNIFLLGLCCLLRVLRTQYKFFDETYRLIFS
jgi:peptidoglycan/LPS O-acetylase OafA/YrhL